MCIVVKTKKQKQKNTNNHFLYCSKVGINFVKSFQKILSSVIKISIYIDIKLHIQVVHVTLVWGALTVI